MKHFFKLDGKPQVYELVSEEGEQAQLILRGVDVNGKLEPVTGEQSPFFLTGSVSIERFVEIS